MANDLLDRWAYKFKLPHHLQKFALVTIANDATRGGTSYYIGSVKRLGGLLNVSERQARRTVRDLEQFGLLTTYRQVRPNGSATANVYQLNITVDPETWSPPGKTVPGAHIMSTSTAEFKTALSKVFDKQTFYTWFAPLDIISAAKARLILKVPSPLFQEAVMANQEQVLEVARQFFPVKTIHFIFARKKD